MSGCNLRSMNAGENGSNGVPTADLDAIWGHLSGKTLATLADELQKGSEELLRAVELTSWLRLGSHLEAVAQCLAQVPEVFTHDHVNVAVEVVLPELTPVRLALKSIIEWLPEPISILPVNLPHMLEAPEFVQNHIVGSTMWLRKHLDEEL